MSKNKRQVQMQKSDKPVAPGTLEALKKKLAQTERELRQKEAEIARMQREVPALIDQSTDEIIDGLREGGYFADLRTADDNGFIRGWSMALHYFTPIMDARTQMVAAVSALQMLSLSPSGNLQHQREAVKEVASRLSYWIENTRQAIFHAQQDGLLEDGIENAFGLETGVAVLHAAEDFARNGNIEVIRTAMPTVSLVENLEDLQGQFKLGRPVDQPKVWLKRRFLEVKQQEGLKGAALFRHVKTDLQRRRDSLSITEQDALAKMEATEQSPGDFVKNILKAADKLEKD